MGLRQHTHFDSLNRACITSFEPYHTLRLLVFQYCKLFYEEKDICVMFTHHNCPYHGVIRCDKVISHFHPLLFYYKT
ncbi:hypothetical protein P8452_28913 [Trifolium repens]|nr:hypothetical protein P8452_28913 [Trifolium repens]